MANKSYSFGSTILQLIVVSLSFRIVYVLVCGVLLYPYISSLLYNQCKKEASKVCVAMKLNIF